MLRCRRETFSVCAVQQNAAMPESRPVSNLTTDLPNGLGSGYAGILCNMTATESQYDYNLSELYASPEFQCDTVIQSWFEHKWLPHHEAGLFIYKLSVLHPFVCHLFSRHFICSILRSSTSLLLCRCHFSLCTVMYQQ